MAVSGKDLIQSGIRPGKQMGEILQELLLETLDDPEKNTKEYLVSRAMEIEKKGCGM